MKITEISLQKRDKKRSNIYVDGNFACGLDNFTVIKNSLKVGKEVSIEELQEMQFESECDMALNYAFGYISKYRKTEKQLREKLVEKGYIIQIIDYVMDKLKDYKLVDDSDYASNYMEFNKRSKGGRLMKYELKMRGVSDDILNDMELNPDDEIEACVNIIEKFFKNKEMDRANIEKVYRKMLSKGFSYDTAKSALAKVKEDIEFMED